MRKGGKEMEIIKVRMEEITPYENNAKLHPEEQVKQIIESINKFGFNDPLAIDENNVIIEGHGRYEALKVLGYEEVECIRLSHMTQEQKQAYILVHNKLTMNTGFDFEILEQELESIEGIDMEEFGFLDSVNIDWADVEEITEDNYDKPVKDCLKCPSCGHVANKNLFTKVEGEKESDS